MVRFAELDPDSDLAVDLLQRYVGELDQRFPGGFDIAATVAAPSAELRSPHGSFLVATLDDEPVGCGAVRRLADDVAEVKRMWISPDLRGVGALPHGGLSRHRGVQRQRLRRALVREGALLSEFCWAGYDASANLEG